MAGSEWAELLAEPEAITALFDEVPELTGFRLLSCHCDERGPSVTLTFERYGLPDHPLAEWVAKGLNALQFALTLSPVTDLFIGDWYGTPPASVRLTRAAAGSTAALRLTVTGPRHDLRVEAAAASVTHITAFLGSPTAE